MLDDPIFLDTSAIVKLIINEPESHELASLVERTKPTLATSVISQVEMNRAVRRHNPELRMRANEVLRRFVILPLTRNIAARAGSLAPASLRSPDAIQLATALEVQGSLAGFVSYDRKLNRAAESAGVTVVSPGLG